MSMLKRTPRGTIVLQNANKTSNHLISITPGQKSSSQQISHLTRTCKFDCSVGFCVVEVELSKKAKKYVGLREILADKNII